MSSEAPTLTNPFVWTHSRVRDYAELMKPELTFLSVLTALCGYYLGERGGFQISVFATVALGTTLLGGGAGVLNQYIERGYDALMRRTERRPLPSGRVFPLEALILGIVLSLSGLGVLFLFTNPLTGALALLTFVSYIFFYTPLKRVTPFATIIGGIPGALPPVMGWTAARNSIDGGAWVLFAILFCWQMPHFLSLAWMYRKDYARAGYKMLTVSDEQGTNTSRQIFWFTAVLIPASLAMTVLGSTGWIYLAGASLLGGIFLAYGHVFRSLTRDASLGDRQIQLAACARKMFFASLIYLPLLMVLMSVDKR